MNSGKDQNRIGSTEEEVSSRENGAMSGLDLGISDLIIELERTLKGGVSDFSPSFSERGRYYQNLVVSGAFEQLSRAVDADLSEHGEDDILTRVYWIHSRHLSGTFPRGMLGLALNRVIRQIADLLRPDASLEAQSPEDGSLDNDVKAATVALKPLVPLVSDSLTESPDLVASIHEAWNELQELLNPQRSPVEEIRGAELPQTERTWQPLFHQISRGREMLNRDGVHGFCKGLFLLLSPLLIYALWSQSRPGGVGSQVLNWVQGQEPFIKMDLLGPSDEVWLPPDGTRRWKDAEEQAVSLVLPVLARIEKFEVLQELSYSLEGGKVAGEAVASEPATLVTPETGLLKNDNPEDQNFVKPEGEVLSTARNQVVPAALAPATGVKSAGLEVVDTNGPIEPEVVEPELEPAETPSYGGEFPRERYFVTRGRSEERGAGTKLSSPESGDYYEIRVPTYIFEHPSFSSFRIAELEVGDEVLGKEIVGRWIKVVSFKGGIGFLPVNDARRAYAR